MAIGPALLLAVLLCALCGQVRGADAAPLTVVDLAGRTVTVPAVARRVTCIHSIPSHMVWRLAPAKLISVDTQFRDRLLLLPDDEVRRLLALPVTGIFRNGVNREDMLALRPDLIFSLSKDPNLDQEQRDFAAPVVAISKDSLADYAASFRLIGGLVGNRADGDAIADYWEATMARVVPVAAKVPDGEKPKVYYAQRKITSTVGSETIMASIIRAAGGRSFCDAMEGTLAQKESESIVVPLEDVIAWDPEVIIAASDAARDEILADPRWRTMSAVRTQRVHAVRKIAMLDRIQSLMGLLWTANTLHPSRFAFDLLEESRRFYGHVSANGTVTPEQLREGL